jgi:hypothetical protein
VTETGGHPARSLRYRVVFSKKGSFLAGFLAGCSGLLDTRRGAVLDRGARRWQVQRSECHCYVLGEAAEQLRASLHQSMYRENFCHSRAMLRTTWVMMGQIPNYLWNPYAFPPGMLDPRFSRFCKTAVCPPLVLVVCSV